MKIDPFYQAGLIDLKNVRPFEADPRLQYQAAPLFTGVNPTALYDCGNPANGYLKFAVNKDFKKNHPKGYKVIKQINFSGPDIDKMAYYMDTEGLEVKAAAQKWLAEHKSKWSKWVKN